MSQRPTATVDIHSRLLKCTLEIEDSRAFWARVDSSAPVSTQLAFDEYWFGARSMARVNELLTNMRERYLAFPNALDALHRWPNMAPDTRRCICHWHLQLTDPLYRSFTGSWLMERLDSLRPEVTRDLTVTWVQDNAPARWTQPTRIQYASKLLSAAHAAGLVATKRDPRAITLPHAPDDALEYLMYLLRDIDFNHTLLDNPYTRSAGLDGSFLEDRLRQLPGLNYSRQGDLVDFGWRYANLPAWADANFGPASHTRPGGAA
jgi:hypothetical protein